MPSDRTPADTEPAPGADAESAGSVVVGVAPSAPDGVAIVRVDVDTSLLEERLSEAARGFRSMSESLAHTVPAVRAFGAAFRGTVERSQTRWPTLDAMHWTPPADGEEIPPCPA